MKKLTVLIAALYILSVISASAQFSIDWLQFPTEHLEQGASVARDNADNSYSAGAADYSIYLTKRDKFGNTLWTTSSTSYLGETPVRSFVDPAGNAVVAAYRYSTLHEGPFAVALIVLKYTPAGNLVYKTVIPGTYTYFNNSLNRTSITAEMDGAGNIYFGTAGIVAGEPASGFNIVKVNSAGVKEWVKTESFGGSSFYLVSKIRLYNGLLGLSGPLSYISGNPGVWVADTTGRTLWTKTVSGVGSQDIAMDKKGNAYVTTFLTDIVAPGTEADICIYKFDKKGNQLWFKGYDFSGWEAPLKMIMAPDNTLVFAAEGNKRNLSLYVDWLTIKIDTAGTMLWNKRYDKTSYNDEFPYALAIDAKNNVYVTGIGGPFPGGSTLSDRQGVVVKYNVKGRLQWTALFDTLGFSGVSIAVASDTSLFVLSSGSSALAHILQHNGSDACNVPSNLSSSAITNSTATIA
ncbi:MAG TPA: hypothetical protein PL045_12515, partial [Chitinophagaceae bacterium]|nr:hypothetical protein [Chitinophagaceae bacterium]